MPLTPFPRPHTERELSALGTPLFMWQHWFVCDSETVKFGHVTFFWNGNRSGYFDETKEEYVEVPSDSGITFNVAPKMKALEIAEKARDALLSGKFDQVNSSEISIK